MRVFNLLFLTLVLLFVNQNKAQAALSAYVANTGANSVSVIDVATDIVTATVTVGDAPKNVAITPDGTKVYVTSLSSHDVSVIDVATKMVIATVWLGGLNPTDIATSLDGTKVYVVDTLEGYISVIDVATDMVTAIIPVGDSPESIAITPDGKKIYVTNGFSGNVHVIDVTSGIITTTVTVGYIPLGIAITPDGTKVYVTNDASYNVSVIEVATDIVIATVTVESSPTDIVIATVTVGSVVTPLPQVAELEVSGRCKKNIFLMQTELFIVIRWSPFINDDVIQYNVYRDNELIATILATDPGKFADHNRERNRTYTYRIVAEEAGEIPVAEGSISLKCR